MKIVHVVWSAKYGGAETMLVDILNYQAIKHKVELLIINDATEQSLLDSFDKKIKITKIDRPLGSRNLYFILKLNYKLLFNKADIIHFHQDDIIRYIPVYRLKNNFCLTIHSVEMDVISLPKYNYRFAVSSVVQEKLKKDYGLDSFLVINGIDIDKITQKKTGYLLNSPFRMVQVGRLEHLCKGQHILLQAIQQLVKTYHRSDFHLDIIGAGSSEVFLKKMTEELGLNPYVTFVGVKSKEYVQKSIHQYDLLIQPSLWEGFGLTVIEAMAALVPVLVSNVGGLKEITHNGKYASVFEPENVEDCARVIDQIIHEPAKEKELKCRVAFDYATQNFNVAQTAQTYLDYYLQILNKTNSK